MRNRGVLSRWWMALPTGLIKSQKGTSPAVRGVKQGAKYSWQHPPTVYLLWHFYSLFFQSCMSNYYFSSWKIVLSGFDIRANPNSTWITAVLRIRVASCSDNLAPRGPCNDWNYLTYPVGCGYQCLQDNLRPSLIFQWITKIAILGASDSWSPVQVNIHPIFIRIRSRPRWATSERQRHPSALQTYFHNI